VFYDFKHYLSNNIKIKLWCKRLYYEFNPEQYNQVELIRLNFRQLDMPCFFGFIFIFRKNKVSFKKLIYKYGLDTASLPIRSSTINNHQNDQAVIFNTDLGIYEKGIQ
jgi:hypothetical protein